MTDRVELPWEKVGPQHKKRLARAGMLVDLRRCTGCHACSVACKTEHDVPLGGFRTRVRYLERPDRDTLAFLPLLCMHCKDAPCMPACGSEAIRRLDDGRVVIDAERCDSAKDCVAACPYGAIYIDPHTDKADKCDFCTHRTEVGLEPACVTACPTDALVFGDVEDPEDPVAKIAKRENAKAFKEAANTSPVVLYLAHEPWMEEKVNGGVQLSREDGDIIYDQGAPVGRDSDSNGEPDDA